MTLYKCSLHLGVLSVSSLFLEEPVPWEGCVCGGGNLPANAGDLSDVGLIPGSGKYPGVHGNSLHYSCLENSP